MKKKMKKFGIYVIGLVIAIVIINGIVPIKAITFIEHKIVRDPNLSPWNKWDNDDDGDGDSIHDSDSENDYGYASVYVDTFWPYTDEEAWAYFKHWFEWTSPCDASNAWVDFMYRLDYIDYYIDTESTGWGQARADYRFFVDAHETYENLFYQEFWDGNDYGLPYYDYEQPGTVGGLTFVKGQTYNIGVEFKIYVHCSGPANSKVFVENTWNLNNYDDPTEVRICWPDREPETPEKPNGPIDAYIGDECTYTVSTTDPDIDELFYQISWGDGGWYEYGPYYPWEHCVASHTWNYEGTYEVEVRARDNYGLESAWSEPLNVGISKRSRDVDILYPTEEQEVSGLITITGTANEQDVEIQQVEIKIDNDNWCIAEGTTSWNYIWDTTKVTNGEYTIYARSYVGEDYSSENYVIVNVNNEI